MHSDIQFHFDQYPHHKEPPPECWEKLDSAVQHKNLKIEVDHTVRHFNGPVVWGDLYNWEEKAGLHDEGKKLFPKAFREGRLWAWDIDRTRRVECE